MIRLWSKPRSRIILTCLWLASTAVLLTFYFGDFTPRKRHVLGPLKVPEGVDPAIVQLEPPPEPPALVVDPVQNGKVDESGWVRPGNPGSIPLLIQYLKGQEEVSQRAALANFAAMGTEARGAVPAIREVLNHPKSTMRLQAVVTLAQMDVQSEAVVEVLLKELRSKETQSRINAAQTIAALMNPPMVYDRSCWGSSGEPPRILRPWVGRATFDALVEAMEDPVVRPHAEQAIHTVNRFTGRKNRDKIPVFIHVD